MSVSSIPTAAPGGAPLFRDPDRPLGERIADLVGRMTLEEKVGQMGNGCPPIPRLGIPGYDYWSEALHGVARNGRATVFPQAIGMAATWDPDLVERVASATADEGRAKYHEALRRNGRNLIYQGLTFWSPNVNIFRDPRWGRGQETWGEDPFLTGEMGAAFVRGLQGDDPKYLKTAACAKHFAAHSGPEQERHRFDAVVSPRDLRGTYLPAFRKLVTEARVEAVMGAYNRLNGAPCCADPFLLTDVLREEWGFEGHVVSDCGALDDIHRRHKVTQDAVETAALALKAGCDLNCGSTYRYLPGAIERGLIAEEDVDRALGRLLATRFKLGMFDPPGRVPFASTPMSVVNSPEHRALAYEAAARSIVLLKNEDNLLPISPDAATVAVVGPNAVNVDVLLGSYHGSSDTLTTLLEGLVGRAPEGLRMEYRAGCPLTQPPAESRNWSINEAGAADVTIACMGLSPLLEGEEGDAILSPAEGDRPDLGLPAVQVEFLKRIAAAGAHIVLVLFGGSPIVLGELADLAQAVLYVWYPGQEGGSAIAGVLFGDVVPSGKLPITFPQSVDQLPPFTDYGMAGRTYRFMTSEPLYPFGFGLSYATFAYSGLSLTRNAVAAGEGLSARVTVTNTGAREAEEVVQVYLSDLEASTEVPLHSLVAFDRVKLAPGESREVEFALTPEMMMLVNDEGREVLEPGEFRLTIGGCSPGPRGVALGAAEPVSRVFAVGRIRAVGV